MADIVVAENRDDLNRRAADLFTAQGRDAISARGRFTVALSGGSTPRALYELLGSPEWRDKVDWGRTHLFWGDERLVPPDDPQSNYRMVREALLGKIPIPAANVHAVPTESGDPDAVARAYEKTLLDVLGDERPPRIDFNLLGLGDDGHTASLFPHTPALRERGRFVVPNYVDKLKMHRITMTLPVLNAARTTVFLVSGDGKANIVRDVIEGPHQPEEHPAQYVQPNDGKLIWLLDHSAARLLSAHK